MHAQGSFSMALFMAEALQQGLIYSLITFSLSFWWVILTVPEKKV